MEVYVIRHGQSEANVHRQYCGWSQTPLTQKGIDDARHAGALLQGVTFDKVYASDLMRTVQTCEAALPGASYEKTTLLRELKTGTLDGLNIDDALKIHGDALAQAYQKSDFRPWQGENRQMQLDRTRAFMQLLEKENHQSVAAFAHAGTVCCMLELALGASFTYDHLIVSNGSISIFDFKDGIWRLKKWNMT